MVSFIARVPSAPQSPSCCGISAFSAAYQSRWPDCDLATTGSFYRLTRESISADGGPISRETKQAGGQPACVKFSTGKRLAYRRAFLTFAPPWRTLNLGLLLQIT